jgi:hypothetical protein
MASNMSGDPESVQVHPEQIVGDDTGPTCLQQGTLNEYRHTTSKQSS